MSSIETDLIMGNIATEPFGALTDSAVQKSSGRGWERVFFVTACTAAIFLLVGSVVAPPRMANDHYVYLAHNLVQGRLTVDDLPAAYPDPVQWQGHKYLPFGPLPAVLLNPIIIPLNPSCKTGFNAKTSNFITPVGSGLDFNSCPVSS